MPRLDIQAEHHNPWGLPPQVTLLLTHMPPGLSHPRRLLCTTSRGWEESCLERPKKKKTVQTLDKCQLCLQTENVLWSGAAPEGRDRFKGFQRSGGDRMRVNTYLSGFSFGHVGPGVNLVTQEPLWGLGQRLFPRRSQDHRLCSSEHCGSDDS